jgi:TatD DNase family protein
MDLVDTHCHLDFSNYESDRADVLQRARAAGVKRIIIPAIDIASSRQALELAAGDRDIFAAVGIHPNRSADFAHSALEPVRMLAGNANVVAIGEIGLDYHWDTSPKPRQWQAFEAQLALASALELPVIIHNREASDDVMAILENWAPDAPASLQGRLGVLHSFSASREIADRALALGFYLGFTGPVTFKKADELRVIAQQAPIGRILIETDAPFLAPQPRRGKRNEPAFLRYINQKLAELHRLNPDEMAMQTTFNAERLFRLKAG